VAIPWMPCPATVFKSFEDDPAEIQVWVGIVQVAVSEALGVKPKVSMRTARTSFNVTAIMLHCDNLFLVPQF
jgi:hypothetical protein